MAKYSVGLHTLGCKVSLYETEALSEAFLKAGFEIRSFYDKCDAYVINTCTVTAESDAKSRKHIRRAIRSNPDAVIAVIGCYSQRSPEEVAKIDGVSIVIGTDNKLSAIELVSELLSKRQKTPEIRVTSLNGAKFERMTVKSSERTRGYVKIEDGCECRCTYCAIADARGPVRSKAREDVIGEVEGLRDFGTYEVVLTGIETGSYGVDFDEKYDLADLLCELDKRKSCGRIRLGSMAPELLGKNFIERVAPLSILVPHFHISMQSGSDNVLHRMKRRYNLKMALENIARIRELMPGVMLTADLMVGFPGESEEDFIATVNFVNEARLLDAHVFAYSKRCGTPAAEYDGQVPEKVKRERSAKLIYEVCRVRDTVLDGVVRKAVPLSCVLENGDGKIWRAHSDSYIEVIARGEGHSSGELVDVLPEYHESGVIYGKIL